MTDTIKIKGGNGDVPALDDREPGYSKTEEALYIGTKKGNVRLCGKQDALRIDQNALRIDQNAAKIEELTKQMAEITARLDAMTSE